VKESQNLELWLKSYEGLKFQGIFCEFLEKNQKVGFSGLFLDRKIHALGPRGCGQRGVRSTVDWQPLLRVGAHRSSASGRSGARELRPRAGVGKEGLASSTTGSPRVGRRWRGVSPAASCLATAVMVVELRSRGNERGRTPGRCEGGGVLGQFL
jgi:hypothetical protein